MVLTFGQRREIGIEKDVRKITNWGGVNYGNFF